MQDVPLAPIARFSGFGRTILAELKNNPVPRHTYMIKDLGKTTPTPAAGARVLYWMDANTDKDETLPKIVPTNEGISPNDAMGIFAFMPV